MPTEQTTWGAHYEDWTHFGITLGLLEDLLPVVSNPKAAIDPVSKLRGLGKTPSLYNSFRRVVGIANWTERITSLPELAKWRDEGDYGICIQTRNVRALDLDITDEATAAEIVGFIELMIGYPLPRRWRRDSSKCLLAFDMQKTVAMEDDFRKRVIKTEHGNIEFLARGQQFIAAGTHPKGQRYQWDHGSLPENIPVIEPREFEVLWGALKKQYGADKDFRDRGGQRPTVTRHEGDINDPVAHFIDQAGWAVKHHGDGRIHIRCPWETEHTTDTEGSTTYFPAGVGGFEQGHFKCLHAHCVGRTDAQFMTAIGYEAAQFAPVEDGTIVEAVSATVANIQRPPEVPRVELTRDKNGIINTATNTLRMLGDPEMMGLRLCYDNFRSSIMVQYAMDAAWRPFKDSDYIAIHSLLERRGMKTPSAAIIRAAVLNVAEANTIDTAIQWARNLVWDGVPRVETFFPKYFCTADNEYTRAVSLYMWSAMAGRLLEPGIQADMVPVLIGRQGLHKTTGIKAMAPILDSYVEIDLSKNDEENARKMRGKLIGELNELRGLQTRDRESILTWITRTHDEWTPKYMEFTVKLGRRLILVGTGNKDEILDDEEERRWLPMRCANVLVDDIKRDRDQLWAEGIAWFQTDGIQWHKAQSLAIDEHNEFKVRDGWHQYIQQWLETDDMDTDENVLRGSRPFTTADVLAGALRLPPERHSKREVDRVARVLRLLGYGLISVRVKGAANAVKRWQKII